MKMLLKLSFNIVGLERNVKEVIQGFDERLVVEVSIYNAGEDAFASYFQLHMVSALSFINTERNGSDFSVQCWPPEEDILRCSIGNPMPADSTVKLRIFLQPVPDTTDNNRDVEFQLETFSVNKEEPSTSFDNYAKVSLSFQVETDLFVDRLVKNQPSKLFDSIHCCVIVVVRA